MSQQVILTPGNLPANYCWTTAQEYYNRIIQITSAVVSGNAPNMVVSPTVPQDLSALWVKTVGGYFEGLYLYQGTGWYRPHPKLPGTGERIIWAESAQALWFHEGGNGTDPASGVTPTTGSFWQEDTAMSFRIPMGIGTNPISYNSVQTTLGVGQPRGVEKIIWDATNLPAHNHGFGRTEPNGHDAFLLLGNATVPSTPSYWLDGNDNNSTDAGQQTACNLVTGPATPELNQSNPPALQNLPPVIGVIFAKRTSRQFIQG